MKLTFLPLTLLLLPLHIFCAEERATKRARADTTAAAPARPHFKKTGGMIIVVRGLAYNPVTSILAYTISNGKACVKEKGKKLKTTVCYHNKDELPLAWSPDGTQLALSASRSVKLWTPATDKKLRLDDHTSAVTALCWKKGLVSGSKDHSVKVWDLATSHCKLTYAGHIGAVTSVDTTSDGLIVSGGTDDFVRVWDPRMSQSIKALKSGNQWSITSVACHPTKPIIAAGSKSKPLELWNVKENTYTTLAGNEGGINALAWNADGTLLAAGEMDGIVNVWNPEAEKSHLQAIDEKPKHPIMSVAWSPEGILAAGTYQRVCFYKHKNKE